MGLLLGLIAPGWQWRAGSAGRQGAILEYLEKLPRVRVAAPLRCVAVRPSQSVGEGRGAEDMG